MLLNDKKNHIISIIIALAAGGFFYLLHPLPPMLIYEYTGPGTSISVWNKGFNTATDTIIGIVPINDSRMLGITHSKINGEPIINLTSQENGIMYQIPHLYPQENVTFTLTSVNNSSLPKVTIRSDEATGIELTKLLQIFLNYMYVILVGISFCLAAGVYSFTNRILGKYMNHHI